MKLAGVRVLDLTRVLSGPYCTALMADLGADVIKIEAPTHGDDARSLGPFRSGQSIYFSILNRGKRSAVLDLTVPGDRSILYHLVEEADVFIENFRPGVVERLGIDYSSLARRNPRLIYASISGFGQDGPWARRAAYDTIVQAASGLMSLTGWPDGPPTRVGESIADVVAGLFCAWGIAVALWDRERTGRGAQLDVSMLESLLSLEVTAVSLFNATGLSPTRVGNRHPVSTPFDTYRALDGMVVLVAASDRSFERLSRLIGQPGLARDPRFATDEERTRHEAELRPLIEEWTHQLPGEDIVRRANELGLPASRVLDLGDALGSEQAQARQTARIQHHPILGDVTIVTQPVRFDGDRLECLSPSPDLGADTEEIAREIVAGKWPPTRAASPQQKARKRDDTCGSRSMQRRL